MRDTHQKFTWPTVSLHWIIAIAIIAMLAFGLYLEDMPRGPDKGQLIGLHKSVGILILMFALVRVLWRYLNQLPKPLSTLTNWQQKLAKLTHWVLIIGTVLLPVSGILMSIGGGFGIGVFGFELVARSDDKNEMLSQVGHVLHGLGGKLLILFVILHIVGAIKHQFIDKDGTLSRMLGIKVDLKENEK